MTVFIILTLAGSDTGPFDLYSNTDGFATAFATDITKNQLTLGFSSSDVPDGTTVIRVISKGDCINSLDIKITEDACFKFFPTGTYYFTDFIYVGDSAYLYGNFEEYQNGTPVDIVNAGGIIKLNNDLTVDKSFDSTVGFNQVLYDGSYIREDNLGRIIVTGVFTSYKGASYNRIIRLLPNGDADLTFDVGTGFNNFTQAIGFDSNESIIIGGIFSTYKGVSSPRIIKLLPNGDIDSSFVVGTGFNNTVTDVLVNSDDSMFVLGYFSTWKGAGVSPGITKLLPNGNVDVSFNGGTGFLPYLPNNPNNFLQIAGETSFYVSGYFTSYNGQPHNRIIKLNPDGTVDNSFDAGTGFNNVVSIAKIVCNDKLFLTGLFTEYNGIPSYYSIILNSDGSVFFPFSFDSYYQPFILGNKIYGPIGGDCIFLIDEFECTTTTTTTKFPVTTTTTSSSSTTTTTSSTSSTTTTTTTVAPTTTSTTTSEPEAPFVFLVNTENSGISNSDEFTFNGVLDTTNYTYNYSITTSDGYSASNITGAHTIVFPSGPGLHEVRITGEFPHFDTHYMNGLPSDKDKIIEVRDFGDSEFQILGFKNCTNLERVLSPTPPNFFFLVGFGDMFESCVNMVECQVGNWNVSDNSYSIFRDLSRMFLFCSSLTSLDVSNWDVSNVNDMAFFIYGCTNLQDLDVSNWVLRNNANIATYDVFAQGWLAESGLTSDNYTNIIVNLANHVFENPSPRYAEMRMHGQTNMVFDADLPGGANFATALDARNFLVTAKPTGPGWLIDGDTIVSTTTTTTTVAPTTTTTTTEEPTTTSTSTTVAPTTTTTTTEAIALRAFPTAEGYGKDATGGRGNIAYKVTNLNDSGVGSFRDAVSSPNRIVVFEVAGYIDLESTVIISDNITIAGQTAFVNGGQGITIRKSSVNPFSGPLLGGGNNNIIRYLRLRPGQRQDNDCCGDAIVFFQKNNVILDHISASFSSDEMIDFTESQTITIQDSFFTEPLSENNPATNGKIFQTGPTRNVTFYRNVIANSGQRNPSLSPLNGAPSSVEFVNNFSFNVGAFGLTVDATGTENTFLNVINNAWQSSVEDYWSRRWIMLTARTGNEYYVSDNNIDNRYKPTLAGDAWDLLTSEASDFGSNFSLPLSTQYQSLTPLSTPIVDDNVSLISAENVWNYVKNNSGVNLFRDAVDLRTISQVDANSAPSNTPSPLDETDFGTAYSALNNLSSVPTDSNNDGIPDTWTSSNMPPGALATDTAPSGYTWLEEYINSIV